MALSAPREMFSQLLHICSEPRVWCLRVDVLLAWVLNPLETLGGGQCRWWASPGTTLTRAGVPPLFLCSITVTPGKGLKLLVPQFAHRLKGINNFYAVLCFKY